MNSLLKLFAIVVGVAFIMLLVYMTLGLEPWVLALGALLISIAGTMGFILLLSKNSDWNHEK